MEFNMAEATQYILAWTLGWMEVLVVLIIALLIFGRRLPEIARSLGKSLIEFKKGMQDTADEIEKPLDSEDDKTDKQT